MKYILLISLTFMFCPFIEAQELKCNCCTETHNQFNFWIGDWEAFNPDGSLAGTNYIEKIQGNCVLKENWTSSKGTYTGTSYNYYNYKEKLWEQIWVDNGGQSLHLKGSFKDGAMILSSEETTNLQGEKIVNRITWTDNKDGTVRQHWEVLQVSKNTWSTAFDGLYKKVKK
ncbi:hypothetical protein ACFQO1_12940 [Jejudonia soesokkakensis]|uniref:Uncharacterized protein n=1 Tax=Jejudonia soesokkakensis TaxID=1323432 RepID=A0ABW2MXS5_9FLAO